MSATLPPQIRFQPLIAGAPTPGGTVHFYAAGTLTPQNVFADDGTTSLGNVLTLDANGATDFRLGSGLSYKIDLKDATGAGIAGWPRDNVQDIASLAVMATDLASTASGKGAALVAYLAPYTGAVARTQFDKNQDQVSVFDFMTPTQIADARAGTALVDVTSAVQAAINSGAGVIHYPKGTYSVTGAVLASFQTHHGPGATITSSGTMFTTSGASQLIVFDGLTFAGTGKAIYQAGIYLNSNWQIKNCSFAKSLSECVYMSLILSQIENNYFGTNNGSSGAQHRHLYLHATEASGAAINQNLIKCNRFNFAVGSHSTFLQYGSNNTFIGNDWESNACKAVHLDGCGVTNFTGNWFESNTSTYQIYAECSATITLSLYYNRAINFNGNEVRALTPGSTAIFYLDANSYSLSMVGNQIYSNNPTVGGTKTYVTQSPAGNNGGIAQYQNNYNYGSTVTDNSAGLLAGVAITGTAGQFSCTTGIPLVVNQALKITGTLGGTGTITGYASGNVYYIIATDGSTTFTLSATIGGAAITTTAGTLTGLTYTLGVGFSTSGIVGLNASNPLFTGAVFGGPLSTPTPFLVMSTTGVVTGSINSTGIWNTGTYTNSPYNYTTASPANMVVLSNGQVQRSTSAAKYKTDVRDLESIDIFKFRAVRYKSLGAVDDPSKDHFGLIADEVDAAGLKELVSYGASGEVEGFQYERLTAVLLKDLQDLRREFSEYKANRPV